MTFCSPFLSICDFFTKPHIKSIITFHPHKNKELFSVFLKT
ncbi:hypothetical protein EUBDOL_02033 [Amedibacillus dolichus DSM 3991]|uniref:Uncharacterized protein n=1 Tax=Amedibacillus dolichus DSM 3991 TaxID=428127 RepID=A8RDR7_9FIRM|nr:hypothetical protein EUBDOL_02033 [Amedibacillus dolichus DSM 3991]